MFKQRCPHCGVKLGRFLYADACPHCHEVLEYNNQARLTSARETKIRPRSWLVRAFFGIMRVVES